MDFLDLRAQASEVLSTPPRKQGAPPHGKKSTPSGRVTSYAAANDSAHNHCILCSERHPLYACPKFKAMSHNDMMSTLKQNKLCLNCFSAGHFVKHCKSSHRCRKCQRLTKPCCMWNRMRETRPHNLDHTPRILLPLKLCQMLLSNCGRAHFS